MSAAEQPRSDGTRFRVSLPLVQYGIFAFAYTSTTAVLPLYTANTLGLTPAACAVVATCSAFAAKVGRLLAVPAVRRLPPQASLKYAAVVAMVGYALLSLVDLPLVICACLCVIGTAYGANSLVVRAVAVPIDTAGPIALRQGYARLNACFAGAAIAGPPLALFGFTHVPIAPFVLACVALASGWLFCMQPTPLPHNAAPLAGSNLLKELRLTWRRPALRLSFCYTVLGWLAFGQFAAALPVYTVNVLHAPQLAGGLVMASAAAIALLSLPLGRWAGRWLPNHGRTVQAALAAYAAAALLAWLVPTPSGICFAACVACLAEIVMMPALMAQLACGSPSESRLGTFAVNSLAMGIGEGIGRFAGVRAALAYQASPTPAHTYAVLAAVGTATWLAAVALTKLNPGDS
jgi:DHA1 family multidrug resistance protein-like MFS transporter